MPLVYADTVRGASRDAFTVPSPREDVLRETFAMAFEENPIMAVKRWNDLREAEQEGPKLTAEVARAKLKDAGMERDITVSEVGITQAALDTLMWRKKVERRRQEIFARSEGGFVEGAQRLGLAIGTTLSDPISMGLNFVPIVGQARYARWLAGARGLGGKLAVRGGVGAVEGAGGAALAEIPIYAMRTQEQADYDAVDSLLNVSLGSVIGAGLHTTVGTAGELAATHWNARRIPRDVALSAADQIVERAFARQVTADEARAMRDYSSLEGSDRGRILNTDLARELSPAYRADRTRSSAVHEPASWLVKRMYERKLAEPVREGEAAFVVFTGGGTGAGKTTGINTIKAVDARVGQAQIIYDTNLNGVQSAATKIDQALAAGREVGILYVWRDPVDALVNGALPRAMRMGRTVPLEEHAKTHVGGAQAVVALAERYRADPRVTINVVDNSRGKGKAQAADLATIRPLEYNRVREDLQQALEAEYAAGRISEAVYRGTAGHSPPDGSRIGRSDGRSAPPSDSLSVADRVADLPPETQHALLRAAVGQAVEGRAIDVEPILNGVPSAPPPDLDFRAATRHAEEALQRESAITLKAAEEEADLAIADAQALGDRLGLPYKEDADIVTVNEGVVKVERWARIAELASVCLVRGG
jgi:hypothetical protein